MKTKEERNIFENEFESLNKKLSELSEDEVTKVTGGIELPERVVVSWTGEKLDVADAGSYRLPIVILPGDKYERRE